MNFTLRHSWSIFSKSRVLKVLENWEECDRSERAGMSMKMNSLPSRRVAWNWGMYVHASFWSCPILKQLSAKKSSFISMHLRLICFSCPFCNWIVCLISLVERAPGPWISDVKIVDLPDEMLPRTMTTSLFLIRLQWSNSLNACYSASTRLLPVSLLSSSIFVDSCFFDSKSLIFYNKLL